VSPPEENVWVEVAPMRYARSYFGTAVVDGKIYAIGGLDKDRVTGVVERYDPQTNTWSDRSPMPTPRSGGVVVCSMGKIYCIGGYFNPYLRYTRINEVYDPATNKWETKAPLPTARIKVSVCVVNGSIYVMGGFVIPTAVAFEGCEVYDPVEDVWSVYDGPWPEEPSVSMVFDGREYVCDGVGLRIHDLVGGGWVDGADLPLGLYGRGVVEVEGLLYALGGCTETYSIPWYMAQPYRVHFRSVFVYTPFGYGRVAPEVCVFSLEANGVYDFRNVTLEFGIQQPVVWVGYSLDGQANVTVEGSRVVLSGLSNGHHSVRVFAEDKYGNMGVSENITFSVVNVPLSMLFIAIVAIVVVVVVVVCVCLFLFLRKRRCSRRLVVD
jgi:hypothetical protein